MEICSFKNNMITECSYCGKLIYVSPPNMDNLDKLYEKHLIENNDCKKYHDSLPTLYDLQGILR